MVHSSRNSGNFTKSIGSASSSMKDYTPDPPVDQMETIPSYLPQQSGCVGTGGEADDQTIPQVSVMHTPTTQKRTRDGMLKHGDTLTPATTPSSRKRARFSNSPCGKENSPSGHESRLSCPYQKAYPNSGLYCTPRAAGFENPNRLRTHLKEVHSATHRCKTCWDKFKPEHVLLAHESEGKCKPKRPVHQCWLNESQVVQLKATTHGTYEEQWCSIAKLLIPELKNLSILEIAKHYSPWHECSTSYMSPFTPTSLFSQNILRNTSQASPTPPIDGLGISLDSYSAVSTPVTLSSDEFVENLHAITNNMMFLQDPDTSFGTDDSTPMHQPQLYDLEAARPGGRPRLQPSPEIDRSASHPPGGLSYPSHESIFTDTNCEPTSFSLNIEIAALKDSMHTMTRSGQRIKSLLQEMMGLTQVEQSEILRALINKLIKESEVLVSNGESNPDGI